ncbi:MAG: hypothetical protein AAGB24_11020 [Bacteroidota bacterium]
MDHRKKTSRQIGELIELATQIQVVGTPPFFKDKVMQQLGKTTVSTEPLVFLYWFTPKLQVAALLLFVLLNLTGLYYHGSFQQEEELQSFAETYGLYPAQEESIFN